jgi:uncharacterized membrane protein YkvI
MEGGFLAIFVLLVFAPFIAWHDRAKNFRSLSPVEQNWQRASHGFTLAAFVLLAVFGCMVGVASSVFSRNLVTNSAEALPGFLFLFRNEVAEVTPRVGRFGGTPGCSLPLLAK